jgi:hypothetical protein
MRKLQMRHRESRTADRENYRTKTIVLAAFGPIRGLASKSRARQTVAKYRLRKAHYLESKEHGLVGHHYAKGEVIDWLGDPSTEMEPVDEAAKERMAAYRRSRKRPRAHLRHV